MDGLRDRTRRLVEDQLAKKVEDRLAKMVEDRLAKKLLGAVFVEWKSLGSCVCMSSRGYTIIICGLILKGNKIEDSLNCRPV